MKKHEPVSTAIPKMHPSRILPVPNLSTLVAGGVIIFLVYAFFAKLTMQFYASAVFLFYSWTKSVWISVVILGVFQTMLMIPFRVINLLKSANIKEFTEKFKKIKQEKEREYFLKTSVKGGRRVALFYLVNFFVQLTSYTSIGRLFLTDFYNQPLKPELLYSFVPYPEYPIRDRFFKIPYLWFGDAKDLGMKWVWIAWGIILGIQAVMYVSRGVIRRLKTEAVKSDSSQGQWLGKAVGVLSGRMVFLAAGAWVLIRHWPVEWSLRVFSGDVSIPNRQFNTITAIVTFITLVWINLPKIAKKVELARAAGLPEELVVRTERDLFKDVLKVATLVGLGAFFITNQIPSAFELSIFTLEMISLTSPLTLDRMILSSKRAGVAVGVDGVETSGLTKSE